MGLILHADDTLVAADKPAGLATIPERDRAADCLLAQLQAECGRLSSVHRLDKGVSGVVLFARTEAAHRALCRQFEARSVSKRYLALVHGEPADERGRIEAPLRVFGSGRTAVDHERGKPSITEWQVVRRHAGFTLLELQPLTGRQHQLRAHLYAIGHPIVGDARYGEAAAAAAFPRLMLHALSVAFDHPATAERMELSAPAPDFAPLRNDGSAP